MSFQQQDEGLKDQQDVIYEEDMSIQAHTSLRMVLKLNETFEEQCSLLVTPNIAL